MTIRKPILIGIVILALIVAIPVGWYLLSPLFINQVVDEPLPTSAPAASATPLAPTDDAMPAETSTAAAMSTGAMATMQMATSEMGTAQVATAEMATQLVATATPASPTATEPPAAATENPDAAIFAQGDFYNVVHDGHGQATIYELADGSRLLRLDDFQVLNGPDLHVYLTASNQILNETGGELPLGVDLGLLKGNIGNQNYDLPDNLDLSQYHSVVIWCKTFRVPFIAAPLTPPA